MKHTAGGVDFRPEANITLMGLNFHKFIFPVSIVFMLVMVVAALVDPPAASHYLEEVKKGSLKHFDSFTMLAGNLMVLFCLVLAITPYGSIRLGGKDAKPEFKTVSWFCMMFAAGMGVGLLYWGVAEPVAHYTAWFQTPLGVTKATPEAAHAAMGATIFHWSFHPWAIYLTTAVVVGYFGYNKGLPFSLSSGLQPFIGKAHKGAIGHTVDVFTVILTVFGHATSIGLAAMQATAGITHMLGVPNSFAYQMLFIGVVVAVSAFTLLRGLDRGVKVLSNLNMFIALALFLAVVSGAGATAFLASAASTTADYAQYFIPLSNWVDRPDQEWLHGWTVFYWAWWCTWGPLVGIFVARISKGRTLRQMVGVVLVAPTVVSILWFTAFGSSAIDGMLAGSPTFANGLGDVDTAIFRFLEGLPLFGFTSVAVVALLVIFMVTSVNSAAIVVDNLAAGGNPHTPALQQVIWLIMIALVTIILFVIGDKSALKAIEAGAIAMGPPFMALILVLMVGFMKAVAQEPK
ncbi:BCCT family transporter [Massilia sp. METH4]|uniref:BCCT family transporter n=1 Tax=Massilia sp. METH4 TaxID=3123041 RepID=UPI0030CE542A